MCWFFFLMGIPFLFFGQVSINPANIEIARDSFGVPHIFSTTDAEAVYGIAWTQCEDNFNIMQENLAILRNRSGKLNGKAGAAMDFICQLFDIDEFVEERYQKDIPPDVDVLLHAYTQAINRYATLHPKEVLIKNIFPLTAKDILALYTFNFILLNNAVVDVAKVAGNKMDLYKTHGNFRSAGSNAMAYSPNITADGKTYLVANPHLPTEGPINFWECSVHSKEGLEFFGATFTGGGVTPPIGTNRYLGWTHTTNYDDYSDVYHLLMHPQKKHFYAFDGKWLKLEKKVAKLKVKFGPLTIPIRKKYFVSKYGPTLKNKQGYFAFRNNAFFNIRHVEQWYKMAKAKNFDEFWEALEIQGLPSQTITYADFENNILHLNNGLMPVRRNGYNWPGILPGNTSENCWKKDAITPLDDLVYVKNPTCGYVFNCNNTPFNCTADEENPKPESYPKTFGMLHSNSVRAMRFKELIQQYDRISMKDAKAIRDDESYHSTNINFRQMMNANDLFTVAKKYEDLADVQQLINRWDRRMNIENKQATFIAVFSMYVEEYLFSKYALMENEIPEKVIVDGFRYAKKFLLKYYGTLEVELGRVQKMVRGDKVLPMYGSPQTLANCHVVKHKKGTLKIKHGDTFIMYAIYNDSGLESMKTINLFGNSTKPESPHYNDQMELFVNKQVKNVEINLEKIRLKAVRIYHPK